MQNNLHEYLQDIANAIMEKKGDKEPLNAQNFADEIRNLPSGGGSKWTGHADAEGLRAIGWDDEDIAYYQQYGVNWNEEDDEYHKVSDDNKALYGVLNAKNIQTYRDRIVYLPKIDTSKVNSILLNGAINLVAIPFIDTSHFTSMEYMFEACTALICIPPLDTSSVTSMNRIFYGCRALTFVPQLDTSKVTNMSYAFCSAYGLNAIPNIDTSQVTNMSFMFYEARQLIRIPSLVVASATNISSIFSNTLALQYIHLSGLKMSLSIPSALFSKESLLYIINNEAATEPITITLHSYAYTRLAEDAEVKAALAEHPNVSLAK